MKEALSSASLAYTRDFSRLDCRYVPDGGATSALLTLLLSTRNRQQTLPLASVKVCRWLDEPQSSSYSEAAIRKSYETILPGVLSASYTLL